MTARRRRSLSVPATIGALAIASLTLWGGGVASAAPLHSAAQTAAPTGKNYVALGDSYSAGYGLVPYSDSPASGCYQADEDYPHLVAAELRLNLTDVTCSGAVTANIIDTPQVTMTGQGTAPPQSLALSDQTDIVTVTIGGNDLGFADVAQSCVALTADSVTLTGFEYCKTRYNPVPGVDLLADKITDTVSPALNHTFSYIKQHAPNAKVFVIGYPAITPDAANTPAAGCYSSPIGTGVPPYPVNTFPYKPVDTAYLHSVEGKLDAAIRTNAVANGATYISTLSLTENHSACAPAADAYINGVTLLQSGTGDGVPLTPVADPLAPTSTTSPAAVDTASAPPTAPGISVKLGALHPNAAGVAFLNGQVSAAITAAFEQTGDPEPTATPTPSASAAASAAPTPTVTPIPTADTAGPMLAATGQVDVIPLTLGAIILLLAGAGAVVIVAFRRTPKTPTGRRTRRRG